MKIICIVSRHKGHIDFGGMGYIKIAQSLRSHGNDVVWISPPAHADQIAGHGFQVIVDGRIDTLRVAPFFSANEVMQGRESFDQRTSYMKWLCNSLASYKPDVIVLDRVLVLGLLLAEQLGIPSVAMGTPGGYWVKDSAGVYNSGEPVSDYLEMGELLKRELGWKRGEVPSLWANSPHLNVTFMGKNFYGINGGRFPRTAHVNHFDDTEQRTAGNNIGVSFGNSGMCTDKLIQIIEYIISSRLATTEPDVFTGNTSNLFDHLYNYFGPTVKLHKWVKFPDVFPALGVLVFFGGIGTIWHCINCNVPMLVVPGLLGDQTTNGYAVERSGIGKYIRQGANIRPDEIIEMLTVLLTSTQLQDNLRAFKQAENYTDTLSSIAGRIRELSG